jgi:hypothetical protein
LKNGEKEKKRKGSRKKNNEPENENQKKPYLASPVEVYEGIAPLFDAVCVKSILSSIYYLRFKKV